MFKIKYKKIENAPMTAAQILSEGKVIAWFQGRMEFGPRALGNRSILGDPRSLSMKDKINILVKNREAWRPFAPSVLEDCVDEYFEPAYNGQHMTVSLLCKHNFREIIPAAIHLDGTARIQTVSRKKNEKYYSLLSEFYRITGVPVILNTSFNVRDNPMVCNPIDAIVNFFSSGLQHLIIGNYLVEKSDGE